MMILSALISHAGKLMTNAFFFQGKRTRKQWMERPDFQKGYHCDLIKSPYKSKTNDHVCNFLNLSILAV